MNSSSDDDSGDGHVERCKGYSGDLSLQKSKEEASLRGTLTCADMKKSFGETSYLYEIIQFAVDICHEMYHGQSTATLQGAYELHGAGRSRTLADRGWSMNAVTMVHERAEHVETRGKVVIIG